MHHYCTLLLLQWSTSPSPSSSSSTYSRRHLECITIQCLLQCVLCLWARKPTAFLSCPLLSMLWMCVCVYVSLANPLGCVCMSTVCLIAYPHIWSTKKIKKVTATTTLLNFYNRNIVLVRHHFSIYLFKSIFVLFLCLLSNESIDSLIESIYTISFYDIGHYTFHWYEKRSYFDPLSIQLSVF